MSADIGALNRASNETITTVTLGNFPALHRNDISPASIQHCIIPSFIFGIVFFFSRLTYNHDNLANEDWNVKKRKAFQK